MIAPFTVEATGSHAAILESGGPIRTDINRSVPVFQAVLFLRG
jgi:hypothetical protein